MEHRSGKPSLTHVVHLTHLLHIYSIGHWNYWCFSGKTALHTLLQCDKPRLSIVKLLLERGAKLLARNANDETCLEIINRKMPQSLAQLKLGQRFLHISAVSLKYFYRISIELIGRQKIVSYKECYRCSDDCKFSSKNHAQNEHIHYKSVLCQLHRLNASEKIFSLRLWTVAEGAFNVLLKQSNWWDHW